MTDEKQLTVTRGSYLMPALGMEQAITRYNLLVQFVREAMKQGTDYGTIPGTSNKPTLLKPGAERLTTYFGLTPRFVTVKEMEDWTGQHNGGEPFFYYWFRCQLWRGDILVAEADGSCNSHEKKYRYRQAERLCPKCGKAAIIKGKDEYGGGWLCFTKKGGCGTKFKDGDQAIEGQQLGQVLNPDIADQANTILKMAQKRALIAATLMAVNASEFFTQDLEDLDIIEGHCTAVEEPPKPEPKGPAWQPTTVQAGEEPPPAPPEPQQAAPASKAKPGKNLAEIKTSKWNAAAIKVANAFPAKYMKDGAPDFPHMAGAARKLGFAEITDANIDEVADALSQHAIDKAGQAELL